MPGLGRELVEHKLPIKLGFKPYRQPPRNYDYTLYTCIKEEVDRRLSLFNHVEMWSGWLISFW
jgi:hypothetical protein